MKITSKLRRTYLIIEPLTYLSVFILTGFGIYYILITRNAELFDSLSILVFTVLLFSLIFFFRFLFNDLKQIVVSEDGIKIKYFFKSGLEYIKFVEISTFKTSRHSNHQFAGKRDGFQILEMHLKNGKLITFDANQFKNYHQLKAHLYYYFRKTNIKT